MESYERLSLAFKEMLKRVKIMRVRLKILTETMKKFMNKSEQFWDMQLEYDGINTSLEFLKPEIKRTIIMLKICLYRQKNEKNNSDEGNNNATLNSKHKNGALEKQAKSQRRRVHDSSPQCPPSSKKMRTLTVDSINNTATESAILLKELSHLEERVTIGGKKSKKTWKYDRLHTGKIEINFLIWTLQTKNFTQIRNPCLKKSFNFPYIFTCIQKFENIHFVKSKFYIWKKIGRFKKLQYEHPSVSNQKKRKKTPDNRINYYE